MFFSFFRAPESPPRKLDFFLAALLDRRSILVFFFNFQTSEPPPRELDSFSAALLERRPILFFLIYEPPNRLLGSWIPFWRHFWNAVPFWFFKFFEPPNHLPGTLEPNLNF